MTDGRARVNRVQADNYFMCRHHTPSRRTRHLYWSLDPITGDRVGEGRKCGQCGGVWNLLQDGASARAYLENRLFEEAAR